MSNNLSQKLKELPISAGVYFYKNQQAEIIYIGKAAVLKNRVRQYFQKSAKFDTKTKALIQEIADVDWIKTDSEVDALFLESEMVKRYMPKYNVLLRDDKAQVFIRIDMKSDWPTVTLTRNPLSDEAEYFGPFYSRVAIYKSLRYLRRIFPFFEKPPKMQQSKLNEDIGLTPKIAEGSVVYKNNLRKLIKYITGNNKQVIDELTAKMLKLSQNHHFEQAGQVRDKLNMLKELQRRVMFGDQEFLDISKDQALSDLRQLLHLVQTPYRIEGFDISHMSGTNVVASMVVFVNGASSRAKYRKFKLQKQQNNDFASMQEIMRRRFSANNIKKWDLPDLILIDGGKGQLDAARKACLENDIRLPMIGLAKKFEQIIIDHQTTLTVLNQQKLRQLQGFYHITDNFTVVDLPKNSHIIKLLQRIRDESHRFAVNYHTILKRQGQLQNSLESIDGIGPKTRKILLQKFGSIANIKRQNEAALTAVVGKNKAHKIKQNLS